MDALILSGTSINIGNKMQINNSPIPFNNSIGRYAAGNLTMSSREIADLTGKDHANVMRDIRNMLKELGIGVIKFESSYLSLQNKELLCFNLPRREVEILLTGYSVKLRAKVIDRLNELEAKQTQQIALPNFNNPAEAARAWAEQYEAAQKALATKAEIGSRREATAMNTAAQAVKRAKKLEAELDRSMNYCTIKRMEMLHHGQKFNWRLLKSAGQDMGLEPIDIFDANYGTVKAYHVDVWQEAYAIGIK